MMLFKAACYFLFYNESFIQLFIAGHQQIPSVDVAVKYASIRAVQLNLLHKYGLYCHSYEQGRSWKFPVSVMQPFSSLSIFYSNVKAVSKVEVYIAKYLI